MIPVAKERFEKVVAGSEGTMATVTESPQLEFGRQNMLRVIHDRGRPHEPVAHQGSSCRDPRKGACRECSRHGRRSWWLHAVRWN